MPDYTMRTATRDEVDLMIEWAAEEGWNPGLQDAQTFYAVDPSGFMVGLLDGEPIGSISVVKYGEDFGFLGFYIVKPAYRGHGYGLRLWNEGMKYLEGRDVGLDGVPAQEANYERWCFRLADRNTRYEGKAAHVGQEDPRVVPVPEVSFEDLLAYDDGLMPAARHEFLRAWASQPGSHALAILQDGRLSGYTVLRPCRIGYKFGPLFADDTSLAEALFRAAGNRLEEGTPIYLDVPGINPAAIDLAHRYRMRPVFETARMYRLITRPAIELPLDRWFGVTSYELG
jgi:GNAT superfamily N-acetyltransferase